MESEDVNCIQVGQDKLQQRGLLSTVTNGRDHLEDLV